MNPVQQWVRATLAIAKADIAEHGFALPRVRVVLGGPVPGHLEWPAMPPGLDAEQRSDWWLTQLMDGRERLHSALQRLAGTQLPNGARVLLAYMDLMPKDKLAETAIGLHIELLNTEQARLVHIAFPFLVREGATPELGDLLVLESAVPFEARNLN